MDRLGGADLIRRLRSIFQRQQHCTYLFLGSRPTMLKTLFSNRRQAFYRFAVQNDLPPVPDAAWRKYLVAKFSSVGMEITPAALDLILNETGGSPVRSDAGGQCRLCSSNHLRTKLINAELVSIVLNGILRQLHDTYAEQWAEITELKHLAEVAVAIAEGNRPYSSEMHRTQVSRSLDMLQRMAIIERTGRGEYRFSRTVVCTLAAGTDPMTSRPQWNCVDEKSGLDPPRAFLFTVDRVGSLQNERAITPQEPPKPASAYRSCRGISSNQQIYAHRGLGALPQISQPESPVPNEVTGEGYELDRYTG